MKYVNKQKVFIFSALSKRGPFHTAKIVKKTNKQPIIPRNQPKAIKNARHGHWHRARQSRRGATAATGATGLAARREQQGWGGPGATGLAVCRGSCPGRSHAYRRHSAAAMALRSRHWSRLMVTRWLWCSHGASSSRRPAAQASKRRPPGLASGAKPFSCRMIVG